MISWINPAAPRNCPACLREFMTWMCCSEISKRAKSVFWQRPGQGKTSFELSILNYAAESGKRSAFFSLEMSRGKVTSRLIAQHSGLNVQLLNTGKLSDEQWPIFTAGIEHLGKLPIYIDDTPAISPSQILTRCRKLIMTSGPLDLVAIDYLQLMKSGGKAENRTQEIGLISRALKVLAKGVECSDPGCRAI